jgi:hypothetical protein
LFVKLFGQQPINKADGQTMQNARARARARESRESLDHLAGASSKTHPMSASITLQESPMMEQQRYDATSI